MSYYKHAELVKELEGLTLRFHFMGLPAEVCNRIYRLLLPRFTPVSFAPLRHKFLRPHILEVSHRTQEETAALVADHCILQLDFTAAVYDSRKHIIERTFDVPQFTRKCSEAIRQWLRSGCHAVVVRMRVSRENGKKQSQLASFVFRFLPEVRFWCAWVGRKKEPLSKESLRLLAAYAEEIEGEQKLLGLDRAQSLVMAITREYKI